MSVIWAALTVSVQTVPYGRSIVGVEREAARGEALNVNGVSGEPDGHCQAETNWRSR